MALATNTVPTAPTGLNVSNIGSTSALLSWNSAADDETPQAGLSYNVRIGTTDEGSEICSPMASVAGYRQIAVPGVKQQTATAIMGLIPGTTYYWSVQSIDGVYAGSPFAISGNFTTTPFTGLSGKQYSDSRHTRSGFHATIYPNPAQEKIMLTIHYGYGDKEIIQEQKTDIVTLHILTAMGEEIARYESTIGSTTQIATTSLASGVYFIRIEPGHGMRSYEVGLTSFIVQK